jgi:WS/DGAT/MGAT family acyltransferase
MVTINTQDTMFLQLEAPDAPMHIGLLMTCRLPKRAGENYMQQLHAKLAKVHAENPPFNLRLAQRKGLGNRAPRWEIDEDVDLEYHLRHEALPWPGGQRELGLAISRLHSVPLERTRPLWECTLIEGLQPDRFALYLKLHHSLGDGVGLMNQIARALAETPNGASLPPWAAPDVSKVEPKPTLAVDEDWQRFFQELLAAIRGTGPDRKKGAPLIPRGPRCILNGDTTGRRRLATQDLSLARIKAIAKAADATVNDVVLAVCSGALRDYLRKIDRLPQDSLLVTVPVALTRAAGQESGNSVASINATLATDLRSPWKRLLAIRDGMRARKEEFRTVPSALHRAINSIGMQVMMRLPKGGNADPEKCAFSNLTISNVPGPRQRLYFQGAEVEGLYPVSVLTGDHRLNVTVLSYRDHLFFGLLACPDTLPSVQFLATQLPVALAELEAAVPGARAPASRKKPQRAQAVARR